VEYAYRQRETGERRGERKKKLPNMWQLEADNDTDIEWTKCFN
jgi:hypothetical protein